MYEYEYTRICYIYLYAFSQFFLVLIERGASQWECTVRAESARMEVAGFEAVRTHGVHEDIHEVHGRRAALLGPD